MQIIEDFEEIRILDKNKETKGNTSKTYLSPDHYNHYKPESFILSHLCIVRDKENVANR